MLYRYRYIYLTTSFDKVFHMYVGKCTFFQIDVWLEKALPFMVGVLAVIVAILLPLTISNYLQISSKSEFELGNPNSCKYARLRL